MYEKIKELAECNRTARTDAERAAVKAEMEALQRDDPAAYADALECLIHETAKEVEELTVSEKLGVVTTTRSGHYSSGMTATLHFVRLLASVRSLK